MNLGTLVLAAGLAAGAWLAWKAYARRWAVGLGSASVLPTVTVVEQITWPVLAGVAGLVGVVAWHRWARTSATVTRWGDRIRRKSGVASTWDIVCTGGAYAVRKKTSTVRPSLGERPRRRRVLMRTVEVGVELCRVGLQRVWASIEDVILVFGGPRTVKSGWLAARILDAAGAVLVTSTRTDLHDITAKLRAQLGPVYVFNAVGLGDLASTITFDPLTGCASAVTANERAADLLGATNNHGGRGGAGDREFWEGQARRILAALLHAAALDGASMSDVAEWVARPEAVRDQLVAALRRSPERGYVDELTQFISTNDRTRTSITSTIMPALSWLTHPAASASASGELPFDVAELLNTRATVFLLGAEETQAAPLVCALTGHIAREARRIAARQPSGRLDPPLTLALDEAALIPPVPLHSWTADMGGRGVSIIAAFQSRAQLIDRYGDAKAAVTLNNAGAKMLFGGTGDRDDLMFWSTLAGDREEPITTTDMNGRVASRSTRRVPVLSPAQLANLPAGRVVVYRRGMPVAVGRTRMAWRRPDVRAMQHPTSLRVRGRAIVRRSGAVAAVPFTWAVTGIVTVTAPGRAAVGVWMRARRADVLALVSWMRTLVAPRPAAAEADPAPPVAVDAAVPGQVILFPTDRWANGDEPANPAPPAAGPSQDWAREWQRGGDADPGRGSGR